MGFPVAAHRGPWIVGTVFALGLLGAAAYRLGTERFPRPDAQSVASSTAQKKPVYHELIEGSRYSNQDLGLAFSAPDGWRGAPGDRTRDRHPYEGLVVRMNPPSTPGKKGEIQPQVTVIRRSLGPGAPVDPIAYIARNVLTREKYVTEPPQVLAVSGCRVGKVAFQVSSGPVRLRVLQWVYLTESEVILLTASASEGEFAHWRDKFEEVFSSLKLGSSLGKG